MPSAAVADMVVVAGMTVAAVWTAEPGGNGGAAASAPSFMQADAAREPMQRAAATSTVAVL